LDGAGERNVGNAGSRRTTGKGRGEECQFSIGVLTEPIGPAMPSGSYTFSLRATNAGGTSAASSPVTLAPPAGCTGVLENPRNLLAYRLGNTAYVVWDPPLGGQAPAGYVLNVSGSFVGSIPTTGRMLSGAVGPGTYDLSLVATNACGTGAAATAVLVVP
jgi:hypothetical protein